jgi:hypothetical protein
VFCYIETNSSFSTLCCITFVFGLLPHSIIFELDRFLQWDLTGWWLQCAAPCCIYSHCRLGSLSLVGRTWHTSRHCEALLLIPSFLGTILSFIYYLFRNMPSSSSISLPSIKDGDTCMCFGFFPSLTDLFYFIFGFFGVYAVPKLWKWISDFQVSDTVILIKLIGKFFRWCALSVVWLGS